jgi:DMSO reductase anchor subunit
MNKNGRDQIVRYMAVAVAALCAGLLISFGHYAT